MKLFFERKSIRNLVIIIMLLLSLQFVGIDVCKHSYMAEESGLIEVSKSNDILDLKGKIVYEGIGEDTLKAVAGAAFMVLILCVGSLFGPLIAAVAGLTSTNNSGSNTDLQNEKVQASKASVNSLFDSIRSFITNILQPVFSVITGLFNSSDTTAKDSDPLAPKNINKILRKNGFYYINVDGNGNPRDCRNKNVNITSLPVCLAYSQIGYNKSRSSYNTVDNNFKKTQINNYKPSYANGTGWCNVFVNWAYKLAEMSKPYQVGNIYGGKNLGSAREGVVVYDKKHIGFIYNNGTTWMSIDGNWGVSKGDSHTGVNSQKFNETKSNLKTNEVKYYGI